MVQREGVGRGPSHHAGSRVRQEHGGPDWHHMVEIRERVVPGNGDRQAESKMSSLIQLFEGPFYCFSE